MTTELFNRLRSLDLPIGDYAVFGSGPLLIRGIVPRVNDLDVLCRGAAWAQVIRIGEETYLPEYDVTVVTMDDGALSFGTSWAIGDFDTDELIDTAEIIDGLPFVRLEHVVRYKEIRSSDKDRIHLAALNRNAGKFRV